MYNKSFNINNLMINIKELPVLVFKKTQKMYIDYFGLGYLNILKLGYLNIKSKKLI